MLDESNADQPFKLIENTEAGIRLAVVESRLIKLMPEIRKAGATHVKTDLICQKITDSGSLARVTNKAEKATIDSMLRDHEVGSRTP